MAASQQGHPPVSRAREAGAARARRRRWPAILAGLILGGSAAAGGFAQPLDPSAGDPEAAGGRLHQQVEDGAEVAFSDQELAWARAAWAYFGPPPAAPAAPQPALPAAGGCCCCGSGTPSGDAGGTPPPPPPPPFLAPTRGGTNVATPWSVGDQIAALLLAREFGIIGPAEFDGRLSRVLEWLNRMALGPDGMPNRFYEVTSGESLGGDLQPGVAGWSAVDTGRLLLWLRIAAVAYPEFSPFIRNAVARLSVCVVATPEGRLQVATATPEGTQYAPETGRGYDAYAAQGYRAWGLDLPLPQAGAEATYEIEVDGVRLPVSEDIGAQAPVLTTPPAYLGLELGFETVGGTSDEVAAGRTGAELMEIVAEMQARRWEEEGLLLARADFRRTEDPTSILGAILARGTAWTVTDESGALRDDLGLITTRGAFALDAFAEGENVELLLRLVQELHDPAQGWFEGRYERSGAWERTRTSATNAFVLEALAWGRLGPLLPEAARPAELSPAVDDGTGACRLPLAVL